MSNVNWKTWRNRGAFFWGLVLVCAALLLILHGAGVSLGYGVSWWRILLGVLCVGWLVDRLSARHWEETIFPLAFLFLIFEAPLAHLLGRPDNNLISNWTVIVAAALLTGGLKVLLPRHGQGRPMNKCANSTLYLDAAEMDDVHIDDNLGNVQIYITNREAYLGGGRVSIEDNVGRVILHLPGDWKAVTRMEDNVGRIHEADPPTVFTHTLAVDVTDNVGLIEILYEQA